jgi:hypothetical protein
LTEKRFKDFTKKPIADAKTSTEVILALSADSRGQVDQLVAKAVKAGATTPNDKKDHGFMYGWGLLGSGRTFMGSILYGSCGNAINLVTYFKNNVSNKFNH